MQARFASCLLTCESSLLTKLCVKGTLAQGEWLMLTQCPHVSPVTTENCGFSIKEYGSTPYLRIEQVLNDYAHVEHM